MLDVRKTTWRHFVQVSNALGFQGPLLKPWPCLLLLCAFLIVTKKWKPFYWGTLCRQDLFRAYEKKAYAEKCFVQCKKYLIVSNTSEIFYRADLLTRFAIWAGVMRLHCRQTHFWRRKAPVNRLWKTLETATLEMSIPSRPAHVNLRIDKRWSKVIF